MNLKEFIEMVQGCTDMVKGETVDAGVYTQPAGIHCSVCLNENGELSREQTTIQLSFTVVRSTGTEASSGHQQL